jgi:hypothetical protein
VTAVDVYAAGPIVRMVNQLPRALLDSDASEEPDTMTG